MKTAQELTKLSNSVSREFEDDIIEKIGVYCEKCALTGKKAADIDFYVELTDEQEEYIRTVIHEHGYLVILSVQYYSVEERKKDRSLRNYPNCVTFKLSWWD